jgi:2-polyprenyl-3-methyl-5-hydroxy-6-metoxy-1,4-benzoquinol methylase
LGTYVVAKECGFAKGIDFDQEAIDVALKNFQEPYIQFEVKDFLECRGEDAGFDAVINFDVIEHIYPEHAEHFFESIKHHLAPHGMAVIGTPSLISQTFASEISKRGHVNIYDPPRLYQEMSRHFDYVFLFSANDELVHTGYLPLAHYLIAVGCQKTNKSL